MIINHVMRNEQLETGGITAWLTKFILMKHLHYLQTRIRKLAFNEVMKINYLQSRPPGIEVTLYNENKKLGGKIYFAPSTTILGIIKHPDVEMFLEKFQKSKS
ncbi:MAG: hypothetical protein WC071_09200 [Victivallaceae bacterium]